MLPRFLTSFLQTPSGQTLLGVSTIVYTILLFAGTHLPIEPSDDVSQYDKVFHVLAYFGLGWLIQGWVILTKRNWPSISVIAGILLFAVVDEVLQIPVGRHCDFQDWIADAIGTTAGVVSVWLALANVRQSDSTAHRTNSSHRSDAS